MSPTVKRQLVGTGFDAAELGDQELRAVFAIADADGPPTAFGLGWSKRIAAKCGSREGEIHDNAPSGRVRLGVACVRLTTAAFCWAGDGQLSLAEFNSFMRPQAAETGRSTKGGLHKRVDSSILAASKKKKRKKKKKRRRETRGGGRAVEQYESAGVLTESMAKSGHARYDNGEFDDAGRHVNSAGLVPICSVDSVDGAEEAALEAAGFGQLTLEAASPVEYSADEDEDGDEEEECERRFQWRLKVAFVCWATLVSRHQQAAAAAGAAAEYVAADNGSPPLRSGKKSPPPLPSRCPPPPL